MTRFVPKQSISTEYLTPQELSVMGSLSEQQLAFPYRPLVFLKCPVGPNSVRVVNKARQENGAIELKVMQAALHFDHNLYMKLQELDGVGNTVKDPTFMGPQVNDRGRLVLVEDPRLTEEFYTRLEVFGELLIPRRTIEGHGPNPERG